MTAKDYMEIANIVTDMCMSMECNDCPFNVVDLIQGDVCKFARAGLYEPFVWEWNDDVYA